MKRNVLLALCALICLICLGTKSGLAEGYTVSNDRFSLTLDEKTLELTVTELATLHSLSSVNDAAQATANASWKGFLSSTLAIEVSSGTSLMAERVDIITAQPKTAITAVENGFDIALDFIKQGQRLTLCVRLTDDALRVFVPGDSIEEYGDTNLCGLYIAPFFGATRLNEKAGYMLIPEGPGALVAFSDGNNRTNSPYNKRIYGSNIGVEKIASASEYNYMIRAAQMITLPVFGMAYTDEGIGFLGVVDKGAEAADLLCYPAGVITEYNWVTAHFILREEYIMQTTRTQGLRAWEKNAYIRDMGICFYLLTGEDAGYVGMAQRYRQKLTDEGLLTPDNTADAYQVRLDFLGADSKTWLLWDQLVPMTTVSQMEKILSLYADAGIVSPMVLYRGWQPGGESSALGSTNMGLEGALGSKAALQKLKKQLEEAGGSFALVLDAVKANSSRTYNVQTDIVRSIGQTVVGGNGYEYYQTPQRTQELLTKFIKQWGADGTLVALPTLGSLLYSRYTGSGYATRGDTLREYRDILSNLDGLKTALCQPLAEYFDLTAMYLDFPLTGTGYSFVEAEVPFLPMVLGGSLPYYSSYINFQPNQQEAWLKMVEYGANPSFLITYEDVSRLQDTNASNVYLAEYDIMLDMVTAVQAYLVPFRTATAGARITGHQYVQKDVALVIYDNGVRIAVNYTKQAAVVLGTEIPAQSAAIVEGGSGR